MRLAATVDPARERLAGILESAEILILDTEAGEERWLRSPALDRASGRRLAVVETLIGQDVDVVCIVPDSLCAVSYAVARAAGIRFLSLESQTPLRIIREHGAALGALARDDVLATWLAEPDARAARQQSGTALTLSDATVHALINRLRRIEGQARGLQRLIAERQSCDQILVQISAMRSALNAIGVTLLTENLAACMAAADTMPDGERLIDDAKRVFQRLN